MEVNPLRTYRQLSPVSAVLCRLSFLPYTLPDNSFLDWWMCFWKHIDGCLIDSEENTSTSGLQPFVILPQAQCLSYWIRHHKPLSSYKLLHSSAHLYLNFFFALFWSFAVFIFMLPSMPLSRPWCYCRCCSHTKTICNFLSSLFYTDRYSMHNAAVCWVLKNLPCWVLWG